MPMTDPYVCHINGVTFTINKNPSHVSINLPYDWILWDVGKTRIHQAYGWMVSINHPFGVMTGGWCTWHCRLATWNQLNVGWTFIKIPLKSMIFTWYFVPLNLWQSFLVLPISIFSDPWMFVLKFWEIPKSPLISGFEHPWDFPTDNVWQTFTVCYGKSPFFWMGKSTLSMDRFPSLEVYQRVSATNPFLDGIFTMKWTILFTILFTIILGFSWKILQPRRGSRGSRGSPPHGTPPWDPHGILSRPGGMAPAPGPPMRRPGHEMKHPAWLGERRIRGVFFAIYEGAPYDAYNVCVYINIYIYT